MESGLHADVTPEGPGDRPLAKRPRQHWKSPIDARLANLPLLACCFVTGLLDTTMFQGEHRFSFLRYQCFFPQPMLSADDRSKMGASDGFRDAQCSQRDPELNLNSKILVNTY